MQSSDVVYIAVGSIGQTGDVNQRLLGHLWTVIFPLYSTILVLSGLMLSHWILTTRLSTGLMEYLIKLRPHMQMVVAEKY